MEHDQLLTEGSGQVGNKPGARTQGWKISAPRMDVGNVECAMLDDPAVFWRINTDYRSLGSHRYWTKMSPRNHAVFLAETQHHVVDPTNSGRAFDDGIEHRLHVRGRAADDAEHLGCCSLML
jgi:hypothetical protein